MSEPMEQAGPAPAVDPALDAGGVRALLEKRRQELVDLLGGDPERQLAEKVRAARIALEGDRSEYAAARRQLEDELRPLTLEHPMRRALVDDPASAAFVREDMEWLRLVLLLYGGCPDAQLASYYLQYQEIAAVLQLPDVPREGALNRLRARPYWREAWDGDDVVYNLAVYLDTECGKGSAAAKRGSAAFDPLYICLDSVLTPFLLSCLRERVSGKALLGNLLEIASRRDDPMRCASALLAAVAIDPPAVFDDLVQLSRDPAGQTVVRVLLNLLKQRLAVLGDGVILYATASRLDNELARLDGLLPVEQWEDAVSTFYRSLCAVLPGPPEKPALVPWMERPYTNAELWATWLSGASADDAKYTFAVVLDTIGKKIHALDAAANLHRAHSTKFRQGTTLALDPIPPVWTDAADMYGEALTLAHESRSISLDELLPTGLIVYAGVTWDEAGELKADALAATLLLPEAHARGVLEELEAPLAGMGRVELEREIVARVMRIADPVIHARALWRLARWSAYWGDDHMLDAAIAAAARIVQPLQRSRAYERLLEEAPPQIRLPLLQRLETTVRLIPDTDNRVRALCRLALLSPREESARLFHEAVEQLGSIPDAASRAETLVLMRKVLTERQLPLEALEELAETEVDSWYRHKAMGLLSFEVVRLHPQLAAPADNTPVVLHALVTDVIGLLERNQESDDSWWRLTNPEQREAALETLLADIARTEHGTLPFTQTVYSSLTALAAQGGVGIAAELLPHLALPGSRIIPELRAWLENPPHASFRRYASLMAAESGQLDAATLPDVLDLLEHGKDIACYRAALVLHSDNVYIGKPDPQHRSSVLGLDAILRIGEFSIRMLDEGRLGRANSSRWTWVNVLFDHPQILDDLVSCIEREPARRAAAARVLSSFYLLAEVAQERFVELLLRHREGPAAEPLLRGFCSVSHKNLHFSVPEAYRSEVDAYWRSLSAESIESIRGLPDRIESVTAVVMDSVAQAGGPAAPAVLEARLHERTVSAPEATPTEISRCSTYELGADPPKAQAAAQRIAESAAGLRTLFSWLRVSLGEPIADATLFNRKRDTLLEIAGYCGHYSPAAVFNLVEELDLQDLLVMASTLEPTFNGRAGAVTLLGYLRTPGRGFLKALKSAMTDTAEVQQAALATVRRLRYVNSLILTDLTDMLRDDDAVLAFAASRLLSVMARHEKTGDDDRKIIVRALSAALKDRRSRHSVCAFEHAAGRMWITRLGTLAQRHYQSLLEIVSIT
jgi:hypothetical protein